MTTINAAAASHVSMRSVVVAFTLTTSMVLAGCAQNGGSLLQEATSPLAQGPSQTQTATAPAAVRSRVSIAPVIGAPDSVAQQITSQLGSEITRKNIQVVTGAGAPADYTLRGYIVAAREGGGTKVSYIWDVTNTTGARVHRVTGEELIQSTGAGDPWASVSPQVIQTIAQKTGASLDQWMPQAAPQATSAPQPTPPSATSPIATSSTGAAGTVPVGLAAAPRTAPQPAPGTSASGSGSIGTVAAFVPRINGAPGDGPTSLSRALQQELARNGVPQAQSLGASYRVEGNVQVGPAQSGQQPIKIDWVVKDPQGRNLGTVSQANSIPAGSLDGAWGDTANAAAVAAAQGILKLLPTRTAANATR